MSVSFNCERCGKEIDEPGGLYFSSPFLTLGNVPSVVKIHLCIKCGRDVEWFIRQGDKA